MGIVIFLLIAGAIIAAIIYGIQVEKKRRTAIESAAASLGLAFTADLPGQDKALLDKFNLAQHGNNRTASLATVADSGELRLVMFDYQYTTGSGKNKQTPCYSVVLATSRDLKLPQFTLTPESFLHRLGDFLGYKDIDFDEDLKFSDQFQLKGADEEAIRQFFNSERRAALVTLGKISIETQGASFLFYRMGRQRDAAHLSSMIEEGFSIYAKLASH